MFKKDNFSVICSIYSLVKPQLVWPKTPENSRILLKLLSLPKVKTTRNIFQSEANFTFKYIHICQNFIKERKQNC
jgi:hypothetical protein